MRQHALDLMPESIRMRGQAGVRTGRLVIAAVTSGVLLLAATVHSRWMVAQAQDRLIATSAQAQSIFAAEAKATELKKALDQAKQFTDQYERIALPINVSAVIATIVNALPESATLDQIDVNTKIRVVASARSKPGSSKGDDGRVLNAEISGFAANDQQIAELVNRLSATPPLRDVSLDFSRGREVYGMPAREFRMSLKIDLETLYEVVYRGAPQQLTGVADER